MDSGDAFGVDASLAVGDLLHLWASAGFSEIAGLDTDAQAVGIGCNVTVADGVDLIARAGYARGAVMFTNAAISDPWSATLDGYHTMGGVRVLPTPKLEVNGGLGFTSLDGVDETTLSGGLVYSFSDSFALTADASLSSDVKAVGIGIRLYLP